MGRPPLKMVAHVLAQLEDGRMTVGIPEEHEQQRIGFLQRNLRHHLGDGLTRWVTPKHMLQQPALSARRSAPAGKSQFPSGIVRSFSFVSTTNTARSLAGCVSLALALML